MAGIPVSLDSIVGLAQSGQLEAAIRACDAALQAEPDAPELLHLRGLLFTLSDQPAAAIPFINRAIGAGPQPRYWSNLGNALWATDRLDEAERAYRNAISLDEGFGDAWFNLGKLLLHTGRLPEAAEALEHVTRINPDVRTWKMLGETYGQLEQFMEARQAYERAFAASPCDPDIAALLADCLEKENRLEDARRMAETTLAIHPEHYLGNMIMAILERRAGRAGEARARLLAMPESSLPVRLQVQREHELGVLYDLATDYGSAYACFARAKSLQASIPSFGQADRDRYLSRLERLIELDYSWLAERRSPPDDGMASPIFIVGFPRSGTTLLNQILNGHPQLHVMEETPLLGILEDRLTEMQVDYPAGLATLPGEQARALRLEYFDLVRTAHPQWDGKRQLVDKLPLNISRLPLAALLFPEA
jgi:tetratricopeptide (TPR) repeat protein